MSEKVQEVNVEVAGGYKPNVVNLKKGVPAKISFTRTNDQGCLDVVHSKDLGFEEDLPIDVTKTVDVPTDKAGEYNFSCGMDMFFGKVVIS
ncbi:cupredoxin domain-containing protein [Companilactobacillus versmoldensis]|uniref:EfeO-type cupredoxin-like domain-containing protein n=1 Tax=Companilactobacillus versmoldensis DSM 14857 = KCTC 3814 TaxID=1423815 RepID=A0A0R1SCB6_9LACO|nr:cupredoxin domain-containing protein [Companilactobacillus versmoldensis]KRL67222.1 hypothetical protein FC27_GL002069 [Companilactobacillus versmoldensis DSM 14857 = KCTC 3814]